MDKEAECPCKSGKTFGECCHRVISGQKQADTAEELMRARYSSYASGEIEFLRKSATKTMQAEFDENASRAWSKAATWHGLEIVRTEKGGVDDDEGMVEFRALYSANGEFCNHHEAAKFVKENGRWLFADGDFVAEKPITREVEKIGRNDPCPCGSGKKYKKCCGR